MTRLSVPGTVMALWLGSLMAGPLTATELDPLASGLHTGHDSSDTQSYWYCRATSADGAFIDVSLRVWRDGSGVIGEAPFTHEFSQPGAMDLHTRDHSVTLSAFAFDSVSARDDRFTARLGDASIWQCDWSGPGRHVDPLAMQHDGKDALAAFIGGSGNRQWSCNSTLTSGNTVSNYLSFAAGNTGLGSDGAFRWYFSDDILFMNTDTLSLYSDFHIVSTGDDGSGLPPTFEARHLDSTMDCVGL